MVRPAPVSKFVPVIETVDPATPMAGEKLVIVGAPPAAVTVKGTPLLTVDPPVVTLMLPALAPLGTVTTKRVAVAETTVAAVPPMVTVLELAVVEKPDP